MDERGSGWILFAGIVLIMAGVMRFFDSLWAFSYHGSLPSNFQGAIFGTNLKTYGWVYLIVAIILFLSGIGVFVGSQAARWIGVIAAVIGGVTAIWWIPFYPIWALTYIVVSVLVIYALVVYGEQREIA